MENITSPTDVLYGSSFLDFDTVPGADADGADEDEAPKETSTSLAHPVTVTTSNSRPSRAYPGRAASRPQSSSTSTAPRRRRKRQTSKREPLRAEFSDEESFQQSWSKWREDRDCNNQSVKRSRMRAKMRKQREMEASKTSAGKSVRGTSTLENVMREELFLLARFVSPQHTVTYAETRKAKAIITKYLAQQAGGGGSE